MKHFKFKEHPLLDKESLRVLQGKKYLKALPVKVVSKKEFYKVITNWFYNPVHYYCDLIKPRENEMGHDENYRYILKKKDTKKALYCSGEVGQLYGVKFKYQDDEGWFKRRLVDVYLFIKGLLNKGG